MNKKFKDAVKDRRTYYNIGKEPVISDSEIESIIKDSIKHTPTSFNAQSGRVVLLLKNEHDTLWDITMDSLKKIIAPESFSVTEEKINLFKNGYGTVLYFEDQDTINGLMENFPLYKDNFPVWSMQSSGILQYIIWTALCDAGFGASLQHYTELIENKVKEIWNIPHNWKLVAQMPFGNPISQPDEKDFLPIEDRFRSF